jgi:hypothetical protein
MTVSDIILNPIRFYRGLPDWVNEWPNMDNVIPGESYISGVDQVNYYTDWAIDNTMSLQLFLSVTGTENLTIYKLNETTGTFVLYDTIIPTEITPAGWVSQKVNRYDYLYDEAGVYFLYSASAGITSIKFLVSTELKYKKRLVRITYQNSFNDFDNIFFDNGTERFSGLCFFTGRLMLGGAGNEFSVFESDRHLLTKVRATPYRMGLLELEDIHYAEMDRINYILSCNTLTVNGVSYELKEMGEPEQIDKSSLYKISLKLTQK